jgi:NADP-dependent 3-hydroxy acid dehydrogenase YdfG
LAGRVAFITGASSGIGHATALAAAAEGAAIAAVARRADRLEALVQAIASAGGRALALPADVTDPQAVEHAVGATLAAFGRIDIALLNAGIGYHGTLDESTPEAMQRVVQVNLMGTLLPARAVLPHMRRQQSGHIIVVSSIVGQRGVAGSSVYGATKAAQAGLVESLRAEFAGTPLRASGVFPVSVSTELHAAVARDFGHRVEGHGPRQSVDVVARAIVACMIRPRPEVYPYRPSRLLAIVNALAPGWTDRLVRRFGRRRINQTPATDAQRDH